MYRLLQYIVVVWVLLLKCTVAQARQPFSKDIWLNETNVAVKVNCLVQDKHNYLWLGTDDGLFYYNGRSFLQVETKTDIPVTAISIAGENKIIGFGNGELGTWDGVTFRVKKLQGNVPAEAISAIQVLADNIFILSTVGQGIFFIHHGYCTPYTMANGLSDDYVYSIISPAKNVMLAATDQGINEIIFNENKLSVTHYTTANELPDNIVRVIKPMQGKHWSWLGTHQGGIALYCSKTRQTWTPVADKPWQWGQVNDILPIGNDRAWVCTQNGYLLKLRLVGEEKLEIEAYEYPRQRLYKLLMDSTGNIWCATNTGLKVITAEYISALPLSAPFALQDVTAMVCDGDTELWLAQKEKLYSISLTGGDVQLQLRYMSSSPVTHLYCDKNDILWVGTFGDGLWVSADHKNFRKITGISPLENESVLDISGVDDRLWIAGLNGVEELKIEAGNNLSLVKLHNKNTGIGSDYVYKIYHDSKKNTWMATDGAGICKYTDGKYTLWDSASGMVSNVAYNITEDAAGRIWASTFNKGLLVYNGIKWESLDNDNGLQSLRISAISHTANGSMLVVHAKGIEEWQKKSRMFRHFERRLGIGIDSVSSTLNLVATDTAGNVYIPYQDGLVCFEKYTYPVNITPSVKITSLNTFFRETHLERKHFNYAENHITFKYDGVNFANPEQLFYRYKLAGYNEEWIHTRDESVTFPQLPSGDYKFVVQVSMNALFTGYGEAHYSFYIARPYWQQWWFILLAVLLVWGVSYTYIRTRERNLRKLSSLQRERMMFEYEHLKSQVNPHFLFNSLNTLTGLIEDDKSAAMMYTTRLSDLYRNMLSHKDKDLISLAEEWEILENYIYIQKSRFGDALQLVIDIPEKLKKTKKVVPMALQLLLENAIKHNIVSRAKPLTVKFTAEEEHLTISNSYQPKISKEKGAGLGLANIRKRYGLYTKSPVVTYMKNNEFIVIIPLI
jgi:ligand-binding sensor domain-containing protein